MTTNEKQAKILRETAAKLIRQAEELETGIDRGKCKHGKYTNRYFGKECKPCGSPKTVLCTIKADGRASHKSTECNSKNCEKFKPKNL